MGRRKNPPYAISPRVWLGVMPKIAEADEFVRHNARIWRNLNQMAGH